MKPDMKKVILMREVQKVSKEAITESPETYIYSSVSLSGTGISDDTRREVYEKHEQFWKEILQMIEARTGLIEVQAPEFTGNPIHECQ